MKLFVSDIEGPTGIKEVEPNHYQKFLLDLEPCVGKETTRSYTLPRQVGTTDALVYKAIMLALNGKHVAYLSHTDYQVKSARDKFFTQSHNLSIGYELASDNHVIEFKNGGKIIFGVPSNDMKFDSGPMFIIADLFDDFKEEYKSIILNDNPNIPKILITTDHSVEDSGGVMVDDYKVELKKCSTIYLPLC